MVVKNELMCPGRKTKRGTTAKTKQMCPGRKTKRGTVAKTKPPCPAGKSTKAKGRSYLIKSKLKSLSLYTKTILMIITITLIINLVAFSQSFCDFYTKHIYRHIANVISRVTDILPFNLGEMMMYLAMIMVVIMIVALLALLITLSVRKLAALCNKKGNGLFYMKFKHGVAIYMKVILATIVVTALIYTLNWFIPFRGTGAQVVADMNMEATAKNNAGANDDTSKKATVEESAKTNENESGDKGVGASTQSEYTTEDLFALRTILVNNINSLAEQVDRDENGYIKQDEDMYEEVVKAMQGLSDIYPILGGYYPKVKLAYCSDILDFMGIGGYTYPYTMEVTINKYTTYMDCGPLVAHEMAHHKGFYTERDANFISFIAGINSDSKLLAYSSYRYILSYVTDECYNAANEMYDKDPEGTLEFLNKQPELSIRVELDDQHNTEEYQENYEANVNKALEENVSQAAESVADVGWDTQADLLEEKNYDGVVLMLLKYYFP